MMNAVLDSAVRRDLLLTAFHEAGHAVMAHLCGERLTRVEILGDDGSSGSVSSLRLRREPDEGPVDPALPTVHLERRLLCLCAGMVCEHMVGGPEPGAESSEELDRAVGLALQLVHRCERVLPLLEEVCEHAEVLLERHWTAVDVLALALMMEREMSGDEVRRLIEPLLAGS